MKELSTPNSAAFRTVRRLPSTPTARLGNAYEFFKNLELISGFWVDTSLSGPEPLADPEPAHQRIHIRSGTGSQTPPDFRAALLATFVKLVAYDFSCNVSLPRVEPRLHIGPSVSPPQTRHSPTPPRHPRFLQTSPSSTAPHPTASPPAAASSRDPSPLCPRATLHPSTNPSMSSSISPAKLLRSS
ncbi:hypothetical protein VC83_09215 [Pseudogymnoascus destructans]|uniref:Uncharacterized protein n=1 Tax=Pseudogymnoascus destructans TaxID=655981 RepID=A0A176ZWY6_9PEZI|nr:uncharacterized protein VC83_09215 [Pseudogymnoascus destructans]OAF54459.1 hypothetical protein VC83_09215 [Pseudogymnoascus destructans]